MSDTVYIKISQSTEVHEPEVRVKDIAQVHCRNKAAEARIKALKVTSFKERDREASYVGSVMDLLEELEGTGSSIQINSVGETDFIVSAKGSSPVDENGLCIGGLLLWGGLCHHDLQ